MFRNIIMSCSNQVFKTQDEANRAWVNLLIESGKYTYEEAEKWYIMLCAQDARDKARHADAVRKEMNRLLGDTPTQMVTIALDQKLTEAEAIEAQHKVRDLVTSASYKWMKNPTWRYEYYSGEDCKWNPHLHLVVDKMVTTSHVRQQIFRKFLGKKKPLECVYNTDVTECKNSSQRDYIDGIKQDSKQKSLEKDAEFRNKHNISDVY